MKIVRCTAAHDGDACTPVVPALPHTMQMIRCPFTPGEPALPHTMEIVRCTATKSRNACAATHDKDGQIRVQCLHCRNKNTSHLCHQALLSPITPKNWALRLATREATREATRGGHKATRGGHKATRGGHQATRGGHQATRGSHKGRSPRQGDMEASRGGSRGGAHDTATPTGEVTASRGGPLDRATLGQRDTKGWVARGRGMVLTTRATRGCCLSG